jgi:hypothetical protein
MSRQKMPEHVASVYKELVDGLSSMKQQQWTITNYAILLLAAVFAVASKGLNVSHLASKLNFIIAVTAVIGSGLLVRIQYKMAQVRARLDKMEATYFTDAELESTGVTSKEIHGIRNQTCGRRIGHYLGGWEFTTALIAVLWGGWFLVFSTL